jgi:sulfite reductase beta subunit-like hemoprotein
MNVGKILQVLQQSEFHTRLSLFYATPTQDEILSRMRTPGGLLTSQQGSAVAQFAAQFGDEYIQITTRANLHIRVVDTPPQLFDHPTLSQSQTYVRLHS